MQRTSIMLDVKLIVPAASHALIARVANWLRVFAVIALKGCSNE